MELNQTTLISPEIFGVIIGGIIGLLSGILVAYFAKRLDEKRSKNYVINVILSEIKINQKLLKTIVAVPIKDIPISKEIRFDMTVYSALIEKIGLLEQKDNEKIIQHYNNMRKMENQLKIIHEDISYSGMTDDQKKLIKKTQTEYYFKLAEEAYKLSEELLKSLN